MPLMTIDESNGTAGIQHWLFRVGHLLSQTLALLLAALLIFSHSVTEAVDHDEHQFVASAALLSRRGLLPYRDYPYLHTPYLVFADALLFRLTGPSARLLLTARIFSAACGFATVALLATTVRFLYRDYPTRIRCWMAPAAVLLLLTNPLFAAVAGLAWNHDAAELLLFAAALVFLRDIRRGCYAAPSMLATGALLGVGIGVRLTIAPAAAAFAGWALADARVTWPRRLAATGLLLLGMAVALAPCGWLFTLSPQGFLFGNFEYPTLNTAYRIAHESMTSSTTPLGKLAYFLSRIVFSSGSGFLLMLIALTIWLRRAKRLPAPARKWFQGLPTPGRSGPGPRRPRDPETISINEGREEMRFLGLLILFLLAGSFAPAPMFIVYFYAPVPFAVLWLAYAWRPLLRRDSEPSRSSAFLPPPVLRGRAGEGVWTTNLPLDNPLANPPNPPPEYRGRGKESPIVDYQHAPPADQPNTNWQKGAAMVLVLCCIACGVPAYRHLPAAFHPSRWVPLEVHDSGVALRRQLASAGAPAGPVLTLAPIIPLEGGLNIYEPFATGPFAFRAAPMVPANEHAALHLVDARDLSQLLKDRPPMAVLFNVEEREEETPMLGAVPRGCLMVRLVHGSSFSLDRKPVSGTQ
jgi:hypothetical protein